MARPAEFAELLTTAIHRIKSCESNKSIRVIQDELGYALGREGESAIYHWRRGNVPQVEDVEMLAREIIRRSDLGQEWLIKFLKSAGHPYPEGLRQELFPVSEVSNPSQDATHVAATPLSSLTIPSKHYRTLVGRGDLINEIVTVLRDPSSRWLVAIDGIGGIGKTALALEVVAQCKGLKAFDVFVWVNSTKQAQGRTDESLNRGFTFDGLLNAVASQLDTLNITHLTESEKEKWVQALLRQQRALIVVDNLEITLEQQEQIVSRLQSLLNPSKALLVSRRRFVNSGYAIHLEGLDINEARRLIHQEAEERRIRHIQTAKPDELDQIITATGGSPLAIKLVLGQLSHLPIATVLTHLQQVKPIAHDVKVDEYVQLYHLIYTPSWGLLSAGSKQLLVAMALLVPGIGATAEVIKTINGVLDDHALYQNLSELWRLSLVEARSSPDNGLGRVDYSVHALTQYFTLEVITQSSDLATIFQENIVRAANYLLDRSQYPRSSLLPQADRLLAMHVLSYAFQMPTAWPIMSRLLVTLAPQMEQAGHRDDWIPYLQQGIERSRSWQDVKTEAELSFQLGILHQLLGRYDEADVHYDTSIARFKTEQDARSQAVVMLRQAQVSRLRRHYAGANQLVETAFKLLREDDIERARGYTVQGEIANDDDKWTEAVHFFEKALQLWRVVGNQRRIAWNLTNLGAALHSLGRYQEATEHYMEAIAILGYANEPVHWAVTQMNLGNVALMLNEPQEALRLYALAELVFQKTEDQLRLGMIESNRGIAYRKLNQWKQATDAYLSSIKRYQKIGNIELEANALDGLGLAYLGQGDYEEAVSVFSRALSLLAQFEGEPGWAYLHEEARRHLQEALRLLN